MLPNFKLQMVRDESSEYEPVTLSGPEVVAEHMSHLKADFVESMHICFVNVKNQIVGTQQIAQGGNSSCTIHPQEIFRGALLTGAQGIIMVHNHPSGSTNPSAEDVNITKKAVEIGKLLEIQVLDHVIIAGDKHTSLRSLGYIK